MRNLNSVDVPIVLCNAGYYGTLAAIRSLGRVGVPIVTVDSSALSPGRFSRHSSQHLTCPPFEVTDQWVDWLLRLGRKGPRRAIYATSDAVLYALARYHDELSSCYYLYQPKLDSIIAILDKGRLLEHARAVGMETPDTWLPTSPTDAERIAREVGGPLVVKPRSQLSVHNYSKGTLTGPDATEVRTAYENMLRLGAHDSSFTHRHPEIATPMLQRYQAEAVEAVYSLSGFRDITGSHFVVLGASKVFQQPRRLGTGLCFEAAPVDQSLIEAAARLCERIGYFGAFEMEFIISEKRALLIDFNGRFYNQLGLDIARGLDSPSLVYAGAVGDLDGISGLASSAFCAGTMPPTAFCNSLTLNLVIGSQRVLGTMSRSEAAHWRAWRVAPNCKLVQAVSDPADPVPSYIDAVRQFSRALRHPRAYASQAG